MRPAGIVLVTAALASACVAPSTQWASDLAAIRSLLEAQRAAWNAGDIEAFMAEGYWESPNLTFLSGGEWSWGYDAVLKGYRDRYPPDGAGMGKLTFSDLQIVPIGPDATLVRGRYQLDFEERQNAAGLFSLVLRRMDDGRWRIVHDHTSSAA